MSSKPKKLMQYSGYVFLVVSLITVYYYIWSPLFTSEFQSDTAEMLLWAQQIIEKHQLISPDFSYSYTLPFGGQLILVPIVMFFGVRIFSLRLGMSIIALIFAMVFVLYFRILFSKDVANITTAILIIMLTATKTLRELFWAHMVFYSLSVLYFMIASILLKGIVQKANYEKKYLYYRQISFLLLTIFLASTSGSPLLVYFVIPLIIAILFNWILDYQQSNKLSHKILLVLISGCIAATISGYIISTLQTGDPLDNYSNYYTVISPSANWAANTASIIERWINLFTELNNESVDLFSVSGIFLVIKIITSISVIGLDLYALVVIKKLQSLERYTVIFHWILTVILIFFFIFGTISNYERRLIPMLVTGIILSFISLRHIRLLKKPFNQLMFILFSILIIINAAIDGFSVFQIHPDNSIWYDENSIMQTLLRNNLSYGYSTDFWFANDITVMSEEKVKVREVWIGDENLIQRKNQTDIKWYEDIPGQEQYFLVCQEWFANEHPSIVDGATEIFRSSHVHPVSGKTLGYFIFVFDHNIVQHQNK